MDLTVDNPIMTIIYIILIVIGTSLLTRIVAHFMGKVEDYKNDMTAVYLIRDIITSIIYFIAIILILQLLGIDITGMIVSLGIVGIALSFAAKDIISNLMSGIILIIGRSIKVGETVEINEKKGTVKIISLRATTIVDDYGVKHIVPNSTLINNTYLQYKNPERVRVDIIAGLPLNIDVKDFREYMIEKMNSYSEIAENPEADVFAQEIKFDETRVKVSFWVKNFNKKDEYKIIITNDIREYIEMGENDEW